MTESVLRERIQKLESYETSTMCDQESRSYFRIRIAELKQALRARYRVILA